MCNTVCQWEVEPVTATEPGNASCSLSLSLSLSRGLSVRREEELAGSPGKTFVFHVTGADVAVSASCSAC